MREEGGGEYEEDNCIWRHVRPTCLCFSYFSQRLFVQVCICVCVHLATSYWMCTWKTACVAFRQKGSGRASERWWVCVIWIYKYYINQERIQRNQRKKNGIHTRALARASSRLILIWIYDSDEPYFFFRSLCASSICLHSEQVFALGFAHSRCLSISLSFCCMVCIWMSLTTVVLTKFTIQSQ